ncbi:glycosyltransferase [Evansella sp. LMS18]|uniref:glycosyltransferase n=1 Tax=Evansella sp. LMS18 TaxID=2924033 RepID=UPI0020D13B00|nr:glycosyltransferase [Evansella sp. LMS18]UTR10584.1 glycosyltransferase [Evansella sp. LMS18]
MKPKISIIVPIYNVEAYLSRCLDSLIAQTITDIEIIAVNDGSTDNCLDILKQYAKKDKRIKIINQENSGVSAARNAGIEITKGDYIGFVDPDDWVNKSMYEDMYRIATNNETDIVMCSYIREFGTHSKIKDFDMSDIVQYRGWEVKQKVLRRIVGPLDNELGHPELLDAWGTVWSKLYKANIIKENCIVFTDLNVIGTNEDSLFNIQTVYYANSFIFINKPYYHYWRANDSSVTTVYKKSLIDQWTNLFSIIENFLKENRLPGEFYVALNNRIGVNSLGLGLNEISRSNRSSWLNKLKQLKQILNHHYIKRSFQTMDMSKFPFVWRMFYYCAKIRFSIGFYFMLICIDYLRKVIR